MGSKHLCTVAAAAAMLLTLVAVYHIVPYCVVNKNQHNDILPQQWNNNYY